MATVYLSPTGSDSYTYAQAQNPATPWLTPTKVEASATSGDTVNMAGGSYTWVTIIFTKSFTFKGPSDSNCILDGGGLTLTWTGSANTTLSFENITFRNAATSPSNFRCLFACPNSGGVENFQFSFTNCIIKDIVLTENASFRVSLFGATGNNGQEQTRIYLDNCSIYNISRSGTTYTDPLLVYFAGGLVSSVISIVGSTIVANGANSPTSLMLLNVSTGLTGSIIAKNTIIYNGTGSTFNFYSGGTGSTESITYSDFYLVTTTGLTTGTGYITSDPLFVDPGDGNFDLRNNGVDIISPCVKTGTNL